MKPYLDEAYARDRGAAAFAAFQRLDLSVERHTDRLLDLYTEELAFRHF